MPSTMDNVSELLSLCRQRGIGKVTLLVVPGLEWSTPDLEQLAGWQDAGCELAAHGWRHRCGSITNWRHRLHSCLLSRNVAEHLSLPAGGVFRLMARSASWFAEHGLSEPQLYVPPAWALGPVSREELRRLPFTQVESLTRILFPQVDRAAILPLIGFEADTRFRSGTLRCFNRLTSGLVNFTERPLRVAVHPYDLQLRMRSQLEKTLFGPVQPMLYHELTTTGRAGVAS